MLAHCCKTCYRLVSREVVILHAVQHNVPSGHRPGTNKLYIAIAAAQSITASQSNSKGTGGSWRDGNHGAAGRGRSAKTCPAAAPRNLRSRNNKGVHGLDLGETS